MAKRSAKEFAIAVNQLISLDSQGPLLEVLDSYFCHHKQEPDSDHSSTDESEDDTTHSISEVPPGHGLGVEQGAVQYSTVQYNTIVNESSACLVGSSDCSHSCRKCVCVCVCVCVCERYVKTLYSGMEITYNSSDPNVEDGWNLMRFIDRHSMIFGHPPLHHNHLPTRGTSQFTTHLIMRSRCIFPQIPCSLVPSTSSLRGSVLCLGSIVKLCHRYVTR